MSLIEIETPDTRNRIGVQTESGAGVSPHADPDAREVGEPHVQDGSGSAASPALSSDRGRSGTSSADPDTQTWSDTHPRRETGPAISSTPPDTDKVADNRRMTVAGGVALSPTTVPTAPAGTEERAARVVGSAGGAADAKSLPEGVSPLTPAASSCPPPVMNSEPGDEFGTR